MRDLRVGGGLEELADRAAFVCFQVSERDPAQPRQRHHPLYLVIEYAPGKRGQPPDRLYLPTDQLDEVTRYSG